MLTALRYNAGDSFDSGNCNNAQVACDFFSSTSYNATISQNVFDVGSDVDVEPACDTCWRLTALTDNNEASLPSRNSIVIKVNNLCPAQGNSLCSQNGLTGTNQYSESIPQSFK